MPESVQTQAYYSLEICSYIIYTNYLHVCTILK